MTQKEPLHSYSMNNSGIANLYEEGHTVGDENEDTPVKVRSGIARWEVKPHEGVV